MYESGLSYKLRMFCLRLKVQNHQQIKGKKGFKRFFLYSIIGIAPSQLNFENFIESVNLKISPVTIENFLAFCFFVGNSNTLIIRMHLAICQRDASLIFCSAIQWPEQDLFFRLIYTRFAITKSNHSIQLVSKILLNLITRLTHAIFCY